MNCIRCGVEMWFSSTSTGLCAACQQVPVVLKSGTLYPAVATPSETGKADPSRKETEPEKLGGEASARPSPHQSMVDAAEMLWVVLANVSGGDWTQQTPEWQEAAARWRDNYFSALAGLPLPSPDLLKDEER